MEKGQEGEEDSFAARILKKHGWVSGQGLGKSNNGIIKPLCTVNKKAQEGIGFSPDNYNSWWDDLYNKTITSIQDNELEKGNEDSPVASSSFPSLSVKRERDTKDIDFNNKRERERENQEPKQEKNEKQKSIDEHHRKKRIKLTKKKKSSSKQHKKNSENKKKHEQ